MIFWRECRYKGWRIKNITPLSKISRQLFNNQSEEWPTPVQSPPTFPESPLKNLGSNIDISNILETIAEKTQPDLPSNINAICDEPTLGALGDVHLSQDMRRGRGETTEIQDKNFQYGSYHCDKFKQGKKCELCSHMEEKKYVYSDHFKKKVRIHGHLHHDYFEEGKRRWWVYCIEDTACNKPIIGSTVNPYKRWSSHKSSCNNKG